MEENTDKDIENKESEAESKQKFTDEQVSQMLRREDDISDVPQKQVDKIMDALGRPKNDASSEEETEEEKSETVEAEQIEKKEPEEKVVESQSEKPKPRNKGSAPPKQGEDGFEEYLAGLKRDNYDRSNEVNNLNQRLANQQKAYEKRMQSDPIFRQKKLEELGIVTPNKVETVDTNAEGFDQFDADGLKNLYVDVETLKQENRSLTNEVFTLKEDKKESVRKNSLLDNIKSIQEMDTTFQTEMAIEQVENYWLQASVNGQYQVTAEQCGVTESDFTAFTKISNTLKLLKPSVENGTYPNMRSAFLSSTYFDPQARFQTSSDPVNSEADKQAKQIQSNIQNKKLKEVKQSSPVLTSGDSNSEEDDFFKNNANISRESKKLQSKHVSQWNERDVKLHERTMEMLRKADGIPG